MLEYKEVKSNHSVTKGQFPKFFHSESNIKKLYSLFSWQVNSVRAYLWELVDSYRFYKSSISFSKKNRNFNNDYEYTSGAVDSSLIRLAESMNISEKTFSRIFFEWQSKFISKTTESGIETFIKLFFKYELIDKFMDEDRAEEISNEIEVHVGSWYDINISDNDNVYSYDDLNVLTLHIEVSIPQSYGKYFVNIQPRLRRLMSLIYNVIVPTARIKFVEISWR